MKIVFFSNFINHHQKPVADELYRLTGGNYVFVEVIPLYDWLKSGGYADFSHLPYVLRAWENEENRMKAEQLAVTADVAMFGGPEVINYSILRSRSTNKISFEVGERWFKKGWINLLSPRLLKYQWYYHTLFYKKPFYRLCSSAFAAYDEYKMHSFKNRCYKWGYFTKVDVTVGQTHIEVSGTVSNSEVVSLMWCSRYLKWKHPELPILMAKNLKRKGYHFVIDMYGSGTYYEQATVLAKKCNVEDVVHFNGNMPNDEILLSMRNHDIFLFTSDQNEGWGAVANEAMSNGCVLVGSDAVGSTPYLVADMKNGVLFKSANVNKGFTKSSLKVDDKALDDLTKKVEWLLEHPLERKLMATKAYETMKNIWSPENAAKSLMLLVENLQQGLETPFVSGPCSKAIPIIKK